MPLRTREELKDYSLRRLGFPVINIDCDEDQLEDRIDDALQFFIEYTTDGSEKVYLKYQITDTDITNGYVTLVASSATGHLGGDHEQLPTETGKTRPIPIEETLLSVLEVFHFSASSISMFDIRYQYALNDLYTMGSLNLPHYFMTNEYMALLQQLLSPQKQIRFNRRGNRLYIDTKMSREIQPADYIVISAYRAMDATVFPEIYDDILVKRYTTALFKRQWGQNLSKFQNVQLPGGIVMNGEQLYLQAETEIKDIEMTVQSRYEVPPDFFCG